MRTETCVCALISTRLRRRSADAWPLILVAGSKDAPLCQRRRLISDRSWTRAIGSGVAYRLSHDRDDDDTVQQIADLFSVPRTTVYGHLNDASEGKRPTIHRNR